MRDATRFTRLLAVLNEPAPRGAYLDRILSTISELFLVDIAILLDPDGMGGNEPVASLGLPEGVASRLFRGFRSSHAFESPRAGAALDIPSHQAPDTKAIFRELGIEEVAWIPVAGSRELRGALLLARCRSQPFGRAELDMLSAMAFRIGVALEQLDQMTRLEQELEERAKAEAALRESESMLRARQDELQKMVSTRDRLFSIIGHDLRGPVGSMCSLLHCVIDEPQKYDPKTRDYILSEILQEGENINLLLYNLMEWGKAQRADLRLRPRRLVLRVCVEEVFALLSSQAAAKAVELIDGVQPELGLFVDADSLQTILRNLVSNAVKFTSPGGRVAVRAENAADRVRILVADGGIGMDEETMKTAFDSAARIPNRGTKGEKGIGLGLVLCKDLVGMNGGSISIASEKGKGTTVTVEFAGKR